MARVGAQDVLATGPFTIKVPSAAPDQARVRLEADFLHSEIGDQSLRELNVNHASLQRVAYGVFWYGVTGCGRHKLLIFKV